MEKNIRGALLAGMFAVVFLAVVVIGFVYRVNLMELQVNAYGGHTLEEREKKDVPIAAGSVVKGLPESFITDPPEDLLAEGKELFQVNCVTCHGETGVGDGLASQGLPVKPRNFNLREGWAKGNKVSQIYATLTTGIATSGMPAFDYLEPRKRLALTHYVRSFNGNLPKDTELDLQAFASNYAITQDKVSPNTIPVALAMAKLSGENSSKVALADSVYRLWQSDMGVAPELFRAMSTNRKLLIASLINTTSWRRDVSAFRSFVSTDIHQRGLQPAVRRLSDEQLLLMLSYARETIGG
jgi:mono/diheme cytochrome c family protein